MHHHSDKDQHSKDKGSASSITLNRGSVKLGEGHASRDHGQMSWLNCGVLHVCPLQDSGVLIVMLQKSTDSFTVQESKVTV